MGETLEQLAERACETEHKAAALYAVYQKARTTRTKVRAMMRYRVAKERAAEADARYWAACN